MRKFKAAILTMNNPPVTSIAANIILGLAMLGAVLIGTNDFTAHSLVYDLSDTTDLQGVLIAPPPFSK